MYLHAGVWEAVVDAGALAALLERCFSGAAVAGAALTGPSVPAPRRAEPPISP